MAFGPFLRQKRMGADLTQRELAEKAKMNFAYLSKVEAALVPPPSNEKLLALADALGLKDTERQTFFDLAEHTKVPKELAKTVIKNPEIGALLRRVQTRDLTPEERAILRRLVDQEPSHKEKAGDEDDASGT